MPFCPVTDNFTSLVMIQISEHVWKRFKNWSKKSSPTKIKNFLVTIFDLNQTYQIKLTESCSSWYALHKKWSFPLRISSVNPADLVTFTDEFLTGKLHFLRSDVLATCSRYVCISYLKRLESYSLYQDIKVWRRLGWIFSKGLFLQTTMDKMFSIKRKN